MTSPQLTKDIKPINSVSNHVGVSKSTLANRVFGRIFAFSLVVAHGLYAGPSLANANQVQEQNPVLVIELNTPVMKRVLKCDLKSQGDLIKFLSSLSIEGEPVTNKQASQEGNECVDVLVHEATYLLSWFVAGLAITFVPPLFRNGKSKSKVAASGIKAPKGEGV